MSQCPQSTLKSTPFSQWDLALTCSRICVIFAHFHPLLSMNRLRIFCQTWAVIGLLWLIYERTLSLEVAVARLVEVNPRLSDTATWCSDEISDMIRSIVMNNIHPSSVHPSVHSSSIQPSSIIVVNHIIISFTIISPIDADDRVAIDYEFNKLYFNGIFWTCN